MGSARNRNIRATDMREGRGNADCDLFCLGAVRTSVLPRFRGAKSEQYGFSLPSNPLRRHSRGVRSAPKEIPLELQAEEEDFQMQRAVAERDRAVAQAHHEHDAAKGKLSSTKQFKERGLRTKKKLTQDERQDFARRVRLRAGTNFPSARRRAWKKLEGPVPHTSSTSQDMKAVLARYKRTGRVDDVCCLACVRKSNLDSHVLSAPMLGRLIRILLARGCVEVHPGPHSKLNKRMKHQELLKAKEAKREASHSKTRPYKPQIVVTKAKGPPESCCVEKPRTPDDLLVETCECLKLADSSALTEHCAALVASRSPASAGEEAVMAASCASASCCDESRPARPEAEGALEVRPGETVACTVVSGVVADVRPEDPPACTSSTPAAKLPCSPSPVKQVKPIAWAVPEKQASPKIVVVKRPLPSLQGGLPKAEPGPIGASWDVPQIKTPRPDNEDMREEKKRKKKEEPPPIPLRGDRLDGTDLDRSYANWWGRKGFLGHMGYPLAKVVDHKATLLPCPVSDNRLVTNRGVLRTASPLEICTLSIRKFLPTWQIVCLSISFCWLLAGLVNPWINAYNAVLHLIPAAFMVHLACRSWFDAVPLNMLYSPHLVACLVHEYCGHTDYETVHTTVGMKARRLATLPVPDEINTLVLAGSIEVAEYLIIKLARTRGFTMSVGTFSLAWTPVPAQSLDGVSCFNVPPTSSNTCPAVVISLRECASESLLSQ